MTDDSPFDRDLLIGATLNALIEEIEELKADNARLRAKIEHPASWLYREPIVLDRLPEGWYPI